jgi:hypothetical protein
MMIHAETLEISNRQASILFLVILVLSFYMPSDILLALVVISILFMLAIVFFAILNKLNRKSELLLLFHLSFAVSLGTVPMFAYRIGGVMAAIITVVALCGIRLGIGYAYWRPTEN